MKVRQKLINLFGVILLLASTFLSPVSAVAQTQSAQSSSAQVSKKGTEASSEQSQSSSQKTETKASSDQVQKDTESEKASSIEEKGENKPGAPPVLTPRSAQSGFNLLSEALNVKEVDDQIITSLKVTDLNGKPLNKALKKWESFKVTGEFKLPDNEVEKGDKTTVKLPQGLQFTGQKSFDIKDAQGHLVATAVADSQTKTLTLTYTDYPSKHSNVTGSFYFYAYVDHKVIKTKQKLSLQFDINKRAIGAGDIDFDGIPPAEKTTLTKSGWIDSGKVLHYQIPVNRSGVSLPNVTLNDTLQNSSLEYVSGTFKIYKGTWTPNADQEWELKNRVDVTNQFKSKLVWTETTFSLDLGNLTASDGYYIEYDVKAKYTPVDGEKFINKAKLLSNQKIEHEVSFTNSYFEGGGQAEGYVYNIKIRKKDEQGKLLKGAEFQVIRDRTKQVVQTVTTDDNGNAEIKGLLKDTYTIKEIKAPEGYQLSTEEIKVNPEDFGTSKSVTKDIINKKIEKVSAQLQVKKELIGRQLKEKEFEFELKKEGEQNPLQTKSNDVDGKVQFDSIEYDKEGTYKYTITEKSGDVAGVIYDPNVIYATVTVKYEEGKLKATVEYEYGDQGKTNNPTFKNIYQPSKVAAKLEVNKVLTGRELKTGEFEFELQGNEGVIDKVKNAADGKVQFKEIEFTKAGTYHYTIVEKDGDVPGVRYDRASITVTVIVEDKGGKLEVTNITYRKAGQETANPTFNNVYTPNKTSAILEVDKVLTGRKLKAQEFEFELKEAGKSDVLQTAKNDAQGKVQFQAINYDKAGEYHYIITEKNNGLTGVVYDSSEVKVTVKVTDDGKGKLSATVTYDGGKKTFKNTFTPKEITVPLKVTKTLTGRNLQDDEFEFELYNGQNQLLETVKNKADGTIPFTALKFTKAGRYNYLIKEKAGNVPGVDYDKQPIKVMVHVQQEDDGQLVVNVTYLGLDESGKNQISKRNFTNKYTAKGTDATFSVTKNLTGRSLKDGEFSFELKEAGKSDVLQTKKNGKDGKVQFDAITYQIVGTYKYTITEKNTGLGGVTYDSKVIKVTVEVTDDGKGQLVSKVTYENNDQTFNNTYSSQKVSAQLGVTKELTGRALNDQEFEFELVGTDDNVRQTKKNAADGRVTFDAIDYTKVGTYHYTIKEKDNGLGGVTYDTKTIKATVTVTDDGDGQLVSQVSYDTAHPTFTNTYLAKETTATLEANKVLTGRALNDDEFAFDLIGPDGKVVETVKNTADGKISFKELTFKTAGTYTYTIKEQAGSLGGVKYDTHTVKATITVTDDGQGQLHAAVAYENNQNTFTNTYSADKATATLSAKKLLEGRNLKESEFEFELKDDKGQVLQTKKNAANGAIQFDAIKYTKAGTYHYTITEKDTKLGGVTYDKKVIQVTVEVTDDGNGQLHAKVSYDKDVKTFENRYTPPKNDLPKTGTIVHTLAIFIGLIVLASAVYLIKKKS